MIRKQVIPVGWLSLTHAMFILISAVMVIVLLVVYSKDTNHYVAPLACTYATFSAGVLQLKPTTSSDTYLLRYPLIAVVLRIIVHVTTLIALSIDPSNIFSVETNGVVSQEQGRRDTGQSAISSSPSGRLSFFGWCLGFTTNLADGLLIVPIVYHSGVVCAPFIVVVVLLYTMAPFMLSGGSLFTIFVLNSLRVFMVMWIFVSVGTFNGQAHTVAFTLVDLFVAPICTAFVLFLSFVCGIEKSHTMLLNNIVFFIRFFILFILSILAGIQSVVAIKTVCEETHTMCSTWG